MEHDEVVSLIRDRVREAGTQRAIARELRISEAHLSDILKGRRGVSPNVAARLGLEARVVFIPKSSTRQK